MQFGQTSAVFCMAMQPTPRELIGRLEVSEPSFSKFESERLHSGSCASEKFIHKLSAELDCG